MRRREHSAGARPAHGSVAGHRNMHGCRARSGNACTRSVAEGDAVGRYTCVFASASGLRIEVTECCKTHSVQVMFESFT